MLVPVATRILAVSNRVTITLFHFSHSYNLDINAELAERTINVNDTMQIGKVKSGRRQKTIHFILFEWSQEKNSGSQNQVDKSHIYCELLTNDKTQRTMVKINRDSKWFMCLLLFSIAHNVTMLCTLHYRHNIRKANEQNLTIIKGHTKKNKNKQHNITEYSWM